MRSQVGSVDRLGPNHYRVTVSAGYDQDGKRRRVSRTIRGTRHEAEQLKSRLLLETSQRRADATMTVTEYLDTVWLPWVKEQVRERTYDGYEREVRLYLKPRLGAIRLDRLDPYGLDKWLLALAATDLSPNTRLHAYRTLHNALRRAVKWRLIVSNPLDAVDAPRLTHSTPDVLTLDEANAYLAAFRGHVLEPIILVALGAGLRRSELAALSWTDLDFTAGTVSVSRGYHQRGGRAFMEEPKTPRSNRTVALPPKYLKRLRALRAVGPLAVHAGARMSPDTISRLYGARVRETEGLRYLPLKQLRHTHATILLDGGADLKAVSDRLGHSTTVITSTTYVGERPAADAKAARIMDAKSGQRANSGQRKAT